MACQTWESFKLAGTEVLGHLRALLHEGSVRQIVVKQGDRTVAVFPVTVGVVGAVAAPVLAAIGALAALLTECTIEVERVELTPNPRPLAYKPSVPSEEQRS